MLFDFFQTKLPEVCNSIHGEENADVVVSLTSYPPRFATLHKALQSLLNQSIKPKRICLWIAENDLKYLPEKVYGLTDFGVDIIPTHDTKSFKKIIPCISIHPRDVIVTADDDVYYPKDWLRLLYAYHLESPNSIVCHRARHISFDQAGFMMPYKYWPYITKEMSSLLVFPIGNGGVLYPFGCFHDDVDNEEIFLNICEFGDDIWLKAMSLKRSIVCKKIHYYKKKFRHIRYSQYTSLKDTNMISENDKQISKVFTRYNVVDDLVEKRNPWP